MDFDINEIMIQISVWALPVLVAVTMHEAAHGWAASKLGDDTALMLGRVSFNPLRHIDPFGTVLMPALLLLLSGGRIMFGFAKPVPVNFSRLRRPRRDMVLVALAGPGTNLLLAVVSALLFHLLWLVPQEAREWAGLNLANSLWINVLLCVFNMLPPLDGGRVPVGLLPYPLASRLARMERAGMAIILGAIFLLPWLGDRVGLDLDVFGWLVGIPAQHLGALITRLTGVA